MTGKPSSVTVTEFQAWVLIALVAWAVVLYTMARIS
jgi:hypothetical protein